MQSISNANVGIFSNLLIAREMEEEGSTIIHILCIRVKYVALQINFSSDGWQIAEILQADTGSIQKRTYYTTIDWPGYIEYFSQFK